MKERRIRSRLGIGEIDATWIYTATNSMYRFHDGGWQCSVNVFYGDDRGWFNYSSEPMTTAFSSDVFIEMLPDQQADDPEFARIVSSRHLT